MKWLIISLFTFTSGTALSQKIFINGNESNGKLKWADFTGKVDKKSTFNAFTSYKYKTNFGGIQAKGDSIIINGFEVTLELDQPNSWAKTEKVTDELLEHEQGHFNLGILTMKEIIERVNQSKFTKDNFQNSIQKIMNEVSLKYREMGVKYDEETNHSIDKEQQQNWNIFFKSMLPELY